jgi:hypothetical protein
MMHRKKVCAEGFSIFIVELVHGLAPLSFKHLACLVGAELANSMRIAFKAVAVASPVGSSSCAAFTCSLSADAPHLSLVRAVSTDKNTKCS